MPSIARALRVVPLAVFAALLAAAPAHSQTTVTAEAGVWLTPGVPGDSAVRAVARVSDPGGAPPGVAERVSIYLPSSVTLNGAGLPTCALETVWSETWVHGCPAGSQVGSGRVSSLVGPVQAPFTADAWVINGAVPGQLIVAISQVGGGVQTVLSGQVAPSDDPAFGSMVTLTVPVELRHPAGLDNALTEVDLLLRANAIGPYVTVAGCPLGVLPFKGVVTFEPPAGPLQASASATCLAGPPPAMALMPRSPSSPPDVIPVTERAVAPFGVRLRRERGALRRLRLTQVPPGFDASVRCLRRCGRRGSELVAWIDGRTVRLKRALKRDSRFEVRVAADKQVTRFARYRVTGGSVRRTAQGCLDAASTVRDCP
jgi:hypothetical protein